MKTAKTCTKCGVPKSLDEFHRRRHHNRDGRRAVCKDCVNAQARAENRARSDPHKQRVRVATHAAIEKGLLVPEPCAECGSDDVEAHHLHYDQEDSSLVVEWLCTQHHAQLHGVASWTKQLELIGC